MSSVLQEFGNAIQKLPIRIGSINPGQQEFLHHFLRLHTNIKNILETGFHVGLSAATMMDIRDDILVTSFDIFWFDYTRKAKLLLDIFYPGRNSLIAGNSVNTLPTFFKQFPSYQPDLVFIDGGHEHPVPYIDIYYILGHVQPGTWVIIDDYCTEHGSQGVISAVNSFVDSKVIEDYIIYTSQDRGWLVGKRSSEPLPPPTVDMSPDAILKLLQDTESHYA